MRTVFEAQITHTTNWVMLIFSLIFLVFGGRLLKRRFATYEKITQLFSSILFIIIGVIGLVLFVCLQYFELPTPQLITAAVFLLLLPLIAFFDTNEPIRFFDFFKSDNILALILCIICTYGACMVADTMVYDLKLRCFLVDSYRTGNALTVKGKVEEFHPMPETLHDTESFSINGIEFSYNNHNEEYYYSKCAFDGGYIKKNGQEVELWYVEYDGVNYIVRIDIS